MRVDPAFLLVSFMLFNRGNQKRKSTGYIWIRLGGEHWYQDKDSLTRQAAGDTLAVAADAVSQDGGDGGQSAG